MAAKGRVDGVTGSLPFVDRPAVTIDAPPDRVWAALERVVSTRIGRLPPRVFAVVRSDAPFRLLLAGEHPFSRYELDFRLTALPDEQTRLVAVTRAAFPGARGRVYRVLVIGSRGHRLLVGRLLRGIRREAQDGAG
jgi:hypothetical protein